jgi:hypothetical protein
MARALTWLRNTSPDCAVPGSALTAMSPVRTYLGTLMAPSPAPFLQIAVIHVRPALRKRSQGAASSSYR